MPILKTGRARVAGHHVMRVVLDSGAVLELSPGHPTAAGGTFGDLRASSRIGDRHTVVSAWLVPYDYDATYDILPDSDTGTYFAAGVPVGSTLF